MIYKFHDGEFRFFTALYGSWANDMRIVFRVRIDSNPQRRAKEKNIQYYDRLVPSIRQEIESWVFGHGDYSILGSRNDN